MKTINRLFIVVFLCIAVIPFKNAYAQTSQNGEKVVNQLISKMTLDEKLTLIEGEPDPEPNKLYQAGYLPGIPRLGIPSLKLTDGPPGIAIKENSIGMPATMGVAATFSKKDAYDNGVVIGRDARAFGLDVVLQPFVNIYRDPTWNRAFNTFGEDPLLTGQTAAAEIKGIQSQGTMAQVKHYIGYEDANNVNIDQRTLHEIYLEPFTDAIHAGVASMMSSYNKINGYYASNNAHNLIDILRNELGFKGWVDSDWGANHGTTFINAGLDMEMPGGGLGGFLKPYFSKKAIKAAIKNGTVQVSIINTAVSHILYEYWKFGLLNGKSKHTVTPEPVNKDELVVLKTGEDAATLLKNENHVLPLTGTELHSLVFIGPGAGQTIATAGGGEKSAGLASRQTGTYQVLRQKVKNGRSIHYSVGIDMNGTPIPSSAFSHNGRRGLVRTDSSTNHTSVAREINYTNSNRRALNKGSINSWTGTLKIPESGDYWLNIQSLGGTARLSVDGKNVACSGCGFFGSGPRYGNVHPADNGVLPTPDGLNNARHEMMLTKGDHTIKVAEKADVSGNPVQVRLNWITPEQAARDFKEAVNEARRVKTAIVFAWSPDNGNLSTPLPDHQDSLIESVASVNPNTIVVLNTSNPVAMPWLNKVKAVLEMWYPGDVGGYATANVLLGNVNPAGRLPFTWPVRLDQGPANQPKIHPERTALGVDSSGKPCKRQGRFGFNALTGCSTTYSEGIFVGYRFYDKNNETPLFPFGYGLSYTTFKYSDIDVKQNEDGGLTVNFDVTNTGTVNGDAVPQVYLGAPENPPKGIPFAIKALAAYDRVEVPAGKTVHVIEQIPVRQLEYWTIDGWSLATGSRKVYVGASEHDIRASQDVTISQ